MRSLPAWGAWIETVRSIWIGMYLLSRSPRGERGLKLTTAMERNTINSRSPRGERGLKQMQKDMELVDQSRSPRGERGLKLRSLSHLTRLRVVAPRVGSVD